MPSSTVAFSATTSIIALDPCSLEGGPGLVVVPDGDTHVLHPGGTIGIAAWKFVAAARGTLSVVADTTAISQHYVLDTQIGAGANLTAAYQDADNTIEIPADDICIEDGMFYEVFASVKTNGQVGAAHLASTFVYSLPGAIAGAYHGTAFGTLASPNFFSAPPSDRLHGWQVRYAGNTGAVASGDTIAFRFFNVDAGSVEWRIDQIYLVPNLTSGSVGSWTPKDFIFFELDGFDQDQQSSDPVVDVRNEPDYGTVTRDDHTPSQGPDGPAGTADLQDATGHNDGPEVLAEDVHNFQWDGTDGTQWALDPIANLTVLVGKHWAMSQQIELDQFTRTISGNWGTSPYGYTWSVGSMPGFTIAGPISFSTDGSRGLMSELKSPYNPGGGTIDPSHAGASLGYSHAINGDPNSPGPFVYDVRDFDIQVKVAWDTNLSGEGDIAQVGFHEHYGTGGVLQNGQFFRTVCAVTEMDDGTVEARLFSYFQSQTTPARWPTYTEHTLDGPILIANSYTPGDEFHVHFRRWGYKVFASVWSDGDAEPADWMLEGYVPGWYFDGINPTAWLDYPYTHPRTETGFFPQGVPLLGSQVSGIEGVQLATVTVYWDDFELRYEPGGDTPTDYGFAVRRHQNDGYRGGVDQIPSHQQHVATLPPNRWTFDADSYGIDFYAWNLPTAPVMQEAFTWGAIMRRVHGVVRASFDGARVPVQSSITVL